MSPRSMRYGVCAVLLALVLVGCAGPDETAQPDAGATRTAAVTSTPPATPGCPRDGGPLALGTTGDSPVVPRPPAGFVSMRVIRCTLDRRTPNAGGPTTTAGTLIRQESGPVSARLLAALAPHDQVAAPGSVYNCGAIGVQAPFFLLFVDSSGATYPARIPLTICDGTQQAVRDALAAIDWGSPSVYSSR